jgi:hypothetical protein
MPVRPESSKEVSDSFKSLKKSLKDTLERLETIGISDFEPPDELITLKAQLAQKEKIIQEQSVMIDKMSSQLSVLVASSKPTTEVPVEMSRLISSCLFKIQDFPDFAESCKMNANDLNYSIKSKRNEVALMSVLNTFNDFLEYSKNKTPSRAMLIESFEYRSHGQNLNNQSRTSRYSDLDQEISDQKKIFSNLCKEIAQSLNPDLMELGSDLDEN